MGQKRPLRTLVDDSVPAFDSAFICAGRRGMEIEPAPRNLIRITSAQVAAIQR